MNKIYIGLIVLALGSFTQQYAVMELKDAIKPTKSVANEAWGTVKNTKGERHVVMLPNSNESVTYSVAFPHSKKLELQFVNKTPAGAAIHTVSLYRKFPGDPVFHQFGQIITTGKVKKLGKDNKQGRAQLPITVYPNGVLKMPDLERPGKALFMHITDESTKPLGVAVAAAKEKARKKVMKTARMKNMQ